MFLNRTFKPYNQKGFNNQTRKKNRFKQHFPKQDFF